jgi:hypothetical protein
LVATEVRIGESPTALSWAGTILIIIAPHNTTLAGVGKLIAEVTTVAAGEGVGISNKPVGISSRQGHCGSKNS